MGTFPGTTSGTFKHGASAYSRHHCRCAICVSERKKLSESGRKLLKGKEPRIHGTERSYSVYGCRCVICVSSRKQRRDDYKEKLRGKEPPKHGLTGYDIYGCRCSICVSAKNDSHLKRRNNPEIIIQEKERGWMRIGIKNFTWEDFCRKHEEQEGKCFICKGEIKRESKNKMEVASVDHDHSTGKVRSLLCGGCNKMIGFSKESADVLRLGASYLDLYNDRRML